MLTMHDCNEVMMCYDGIGRKAGRKMGRDF